MLREIGHRPVPNWLVTASTEIDPPWSDLLRDSLYYAACGTDGRPVQYLGGFCHSFVYADYGYPSEQIAEKLKAENAFRGYRLRSFRFIEPGELSLAQAWEDLGLEVSIDGDPRRYDERRVIPYVFWGIFQRLDEYSEQHGPEFFSLLYIGEDGVPCFRSMYYSNGVAPAVVAIIQPGEGFGWNWTYFHDPRQIFSRTVLGNPAGTPEYLLLGGGSWANRQFQRIVVWPGYENLVSFQKAGGYLGLWQRAVEISRGPERMGNEGH